MKQPTWPDRAFMSLATVGFLMRMSALVVSVLVAFDVWDFATERMCGTVMMLYLMGRVLKAFARCYFDEASI